ncbi:MULTISPECIES: copper resistance CopC family protein [unclassified Arthrobacter]|uniref:copper resistance CopC family protein n=1 Tax=unclassified Arthrobacter TaxID=235627 RepID=UPI002DFACE4C|nr:MULTISPECIES: copper resistance CopC family protein [unclassified Arthrobacter]MEC5193361.1 methionine-rich copper-binding protein CopC [Arthrobacter sp. MP_M4]MEC5204827.1 methionine-rich copper-binding protein CopC [Arthrobacter sp. MP_M7]
MGATLLAALLLCVGASLPAAPAAFAHDQLISSSPAPDERLDKTAASITLTFSSPLLTLGHEVRVVDDNAKNWVSGAAVLSRETLTQALPELPDGGYQVSWRVVSADGHPISGGYRFHVGNPAAAAPAASANPTATAEPNAAAGTGDGAGVPGWLPAAGITAAAGLGIYLVIAGLRRIKRNTQSPRE